MKRVVDPYVVPCPYCRVPAKAKCLDHLGRSVPPHERRRLDAKKSQK
jgi:hypothetical protein